MEIIENLEKSLQQTLPYYNLSDADLQKTYGPGKWNIRQILHHLADAESILYERIRRIIAEPRQVIWAFDQDLFSQELNYEKVPLSINKSIYESTRAAVIYYAKEFYEQKADKEFIHSETGIRTLKDEIDKVASHNFSHIEQIEKALKSN